jgi:hypothetical protein
MKRVLIAGGVLMLLAGPVLAGEGGTTKQAYQDAINRRIGVANDVTVHGFRSSFRDWCGEETHFPRELAEHALVHVIGDKAEQAYRRGDALEKRRSLMAAWAAHCEPRAHSAATVILLRKDR